MHNRQVCSHVPHNVCNIMYKMWTPTSESWYIGVTKKTHSQRNILTHHEANVVHSIFQTISSYLISIQKSKLGFSMCQGMNPRSLLKHKRKKRNWEKGICISKFQDLKTTLNIGFERESFDNEKFLP